MIYRQRFSYLLLQSNFRSVFQRFYSLWPHCATLSHNLCVISIILLQHYKLSSRTCFINILGNVARYFSVHCDINYFFLKDDFLESYGYPLEKHEVRTKDGYILTVHRIPRGRYDVVDNETSRPAVLLMHGIIITFFFEPL